MKLTKAQEVKVLNIQVFGEGRKSVYHVTLKEGYKNNGKNDEHFGTQKEVKEFINGAEFFEVDYSQMETDGNVYEGFFGNHVYYTNYRTKIATAREGKFQNGFTEMRLNDLHEGVEGADLVLDTVLKALVKEKDALESGKDVNVYVQWTLSKDRMHYTTCKHIRTEVIDKTVKKRLERRAKSVDCVLGCYDEKLEILDDKALAVVMRNADEAYTDIVVEVDGKQYVVEIATVDNEKDFALYTKSRYIEKYGEEKEEIFE